MSKYYFDAIILICKRRQRLQHWETGSRSSTSLPTSKLTSGFGTWKSGWKCVRRCLNRCVRYITKLQKKLRWWWQQLSHCYLVKKHQLQNFISISVSSEIKINELVCTRYKRAKYALCWTRTEFQNQFAVEKLVHGIRRHVGVLLRKMSHLNSGRNSWTTETRRTLCVDEKMKNVSYLIKT